MEIKKSVKASLENKKLLFLEIGLVLALGLIWAGFSWETKEAEESKMKKEVKMEEETEQEEVIIEEEKKPEIPPEEQPEEEQFSDEIEEVEDDEEETVQRIDEDKEIEIVRVERHENVEVEEEEEEVETVEFFRVEVKPTFQGGDAGEFAKWVQENLQYPQAAKDADVQGRVVAQFVVGTDGKIQDVQVLRGVHPDLDAEVVRVISSSPDWTPGYVKGAPVKVSYTFPVVFKTNGNAALETNTVQVRGAQADSALVKTKKQ